MRFYYTFTAISNTLKHKASFVGRPLLSETSGELISIHFPPKDNVESTYEYKYSNIQSPLMNHVGDKYLYKEDEWIKDLGLIKS